MSPRAMVFFSFAGGVVLGLMSLTEYFEWFPPPKPFKWVSPAAKETAAPDLKGRVDSLQSSINELDASVSNMNSVLNRTLALVEAKLADQKKVEAEPVRRNFEASNALITSSTITNYLDTNLTSWALMSVTNVMSDRVYASNNVLSVGGRTSHWDSSASWSSSASVLTNR